MQRRKSDLVATRQGVGTGTFSPDNQWVVFTDPSTGRGYVAPLSQLPIPEGAWIRVVDNWYEFEWYGNLIYSDSDRDGFTCIWAQRVDAATKRPVGARFHALDARISLANQGVPYLSVSHGRMLFNMAERTGNIWMAEWKEQ